MAREPWRLGAHSAHYEKGVPRPCGVETAFAFDRHLTQRGLTVLRGCWLEMPCPGAAGGGLVLSAVRGRTRSL